jgi:hypothetical protein
MKPVASAIQREGTIGFPPSAPFVTNTEDWVNLALKRVIKEAVDNDIDTVAFIKGGQAADKYSLRTFVDYYFSGQKNYFWSRYPAQQMICTFSSLPRILLAPMLFMWARTELLKSSISV